MVYDPGNIFAKILRGEIPCEKLYEDEGCIAIRDIAPAAPVHALILPKGDYLSFDDFVRKAAPERVHGFFTAVAHIAAMLGVNNTGYRLITNHGADASQSVPHFHVHLLGGKALGGLLPDDALAR